MNTALQILHAIAGFIVVAEALNKLERIDILHPSLCTRQRLVDAIKAIAWMLLALGAAGSLAAPVLLALGVPPGTGGSLARLERPTLAEVLVLAGFATLIVRTRVKEG